MEKEVEVLLEGSAFEDVGVVAGFGTELVVEEEEPVGGCCHDRTPVQRASMELLADGYDSTGDAWKGKLSG